MSPLEVREVCKRFGSAPSGFELGPLSFAVSAGEVVSLVGVNGAGKTTLLRLIAGILRPDAGCVLLDGVAVEQRSRRGRLAAVFDGNRSLYWKMSARENIDYFGALKGLPLRGRAARAHRVLELAGLTAHGEVLVEKLSRGMQQRLTVAIHMLSEPSVLLLDEPTVGVDFVHLDSIVHMIGELKQRGCAIVLTSHQLDVIESVADRALLLAAGKVCDTVALGSSAAPQMSSLSLEVALPLSNTQVQALAQLGARVSERRITLDATGLDFYQILDVLRPNPLISCTATGRRLQDAVRQVRVREAA